MHRENTLYTLINNLYGAPLCKCLYALAAAQHDSDAAAAQHGCDGTAAGHSSEGPMRTLHGSHWSGYKVSLPVLANIISLSLSHWDVLQYNKPVVSVGFLGN